MGLETDPESVAEHFSDHAEAGGQHATYGWNL